MHSLATYSVRVFDRILAGPTEDKYHKLSNIRGKDLVQSITDFANNNTSYQEISDGKSKKTLKFSNVTRVNRTVYGFIEFGEYGIKGKVVHVPSGDTVYAKKKDDSDIQQLYFNFTIPSDVTTGICLFHNIHGRGVKGLADKMLNEFFHKLTKGLKLQLQPLTYEKAVEDWMKNAQVKELRLNKYSPKFEVSDPVDQLAENTVEITYKPKEKGGSFGRFWDFIQSKSRSGINRGAVAILSEHCASVKAVVEFDGRKRTFSLTSEDLPVSTIDFDDEDVKMEDGAPELASLHKYADELVTDMLSTI
jgi:hypothetical protein